MANLLAGELRRVRAGLIEVVVGDTIHNFTVDDWEGWKVVIPGTGPVRPRLAGVVTRRPDGSVRRA